jgi:methylglutaconyl-CoA hydratase
MPEPITHKYVDVQDEAPDNAVLLEATREGLAVVLLNRPAAINTLDARAVDALTEAFQTLQGAEGVRLVLIRGAEGNFCGGADLAWTAKVAALPEEDNRLDALDLANMLKALHDIPALTVALVDGVATGAGAAMVAACDMAVATQAARFAFPDVRVGLPAALLSPYVIEAVGVRAARRLFATGSAFGADEALRIGLVDELAADADALNQAADGLATEVMACAPGAMGEIKRLIRDQAQAPISKHLIEESARKVARFAGSEEAREGLAAALAGRKPSWAL